MSGGDYYSFLICHHGARVDLFVNGIPIGIYTDKFTPHHRIMPDGTRVACDYRNVAPPVPPTVVELKAQLRAIIDAIPDTL
jgi:hypothetical protein